MQATLDRVETVAKRAEKTTPVRISDEAIKWARIASGYTGESVAEYVSRVITERGQADAESLHAALRLQQQVNPSPAAKPKPKGK